VCLEVFFERLETKLKFINKENAKDAEEGCIIKNNY
jgi:hypothetical protein